MPDDARLWIYPADRPLSRDDEAALQGALGDFFEDWASHGRRVRGVAHIVEGRFLLVAATLDGDISGCGIDASVHAVEAAGQAAGVGWLSPLTVFFRDGEGNVAVAPRPVFRKRVRGGEVTAETMVYDPSITTVGELRAGAFVKTAGASWHGRVFRIPDLDPSLS